VNIQRKLFKKRRTLLAGIACTFLAACGDSSRPNPQVQTGTLLDSPVSGIAYSTLTQSGVTNAQGHFTFRPGEEISFRLGELHLGTTLGRNQVTLFNLAGVSSLPENLTELYESLSEKAEHRPLHHAINLGVLLQTLDADAEPNNGIEILPAVAQHFTASSLWLSQPYTRFQNSHRLRQILRATDQASLLSSRDLTPAHSAFAHMMDQAGFNQEIFLAREIETNTDGVGAPEHVYSRTFTSSGKLATAYFDTDGDGNANNGSDYLYTAYGKLSSRSTDQNGDAVYDEVVSYSYSNFGEITRIETTDGASATIRLELQGYDTNGVLTSREITTGAQRSQWRWLADDTGTRTAIEYDTDGDDNWERHDDLVYDDNDRWIDRQIDLDNNSSVDQHRTRAFNSLGMMTRDANDTNNDGNIDQLEIWAFNPNGQLLEYVRTFPTDTTRTDALRTTITYDDSGRKILTTTDNGDDSTIDTRETIVYSTNDNGTEQTDYLYDTNGDDVTDQSNVLLYNSDRQILRRTYTFGLDSTNPTISVTDYMYDSAGRLTTATTGNQVVTYSDYVAIPLGLFI